MIVHAFKSVCTFSLAGLTLMSIHNFKGIVENNDKRSRTDLIKKGSVKICFILFLRRLRS